MRKRRADTHITGDKKKIFTSFYYHMLRFTKLESTNFNVSCHLTVHSSRELPNSRICKWRLSPAISTKCIDSYFIYSPKEDFACRIYFFSLHKPSSNMLQSSKNSNDLQISFLSTMQSTLHTVIHILYGRLENILL